MPEFPHSYQAQTSARPEGEVVIRSQGLPELATAPPAEFGGPGDRWSPESLLVAAVADCFTLSFRVIAQASKLAWTHLDCEVEGVLDRVERVTRFVEMRVRARLAIPPDADPSKAERLLGRAEQTCFITNSLVCESKLECEVSVG